ncbi:MAG: 1-deoxy-D-xylulose-5-phosphate reductoisomerase [Oscillospiraceae bacterium]|nr:1-deoxy-D-xylulose-5-phosphate reductoisomerase [Oscillospiraceae bacterium]
MTNCLSVLGSTGSIGRQTLECAEKLGLRVSALSCARSVSLAEEQARRFRPNVVCAADEKAADDLRVRLGDTPVRVVSGEEGLIEAASEKEADTVVTAVVGTAGLRPTMAAIEAEKTIALANKETLVCAGRAVMRAARAHKVDIIPVDSEHSAVFQSLAGSRREDVKRIVLTASGGPFRGKSREELKNVTAAEALRHPNWSMGKKVTVESATMMNKGLEVIEAMHLFSVVPEKIGVLVHPQSVVHSLVEYADGAYIAQLGYPDMRLPIQLALTWPERRPSPSPSLDLTACGPLTFEEPDTEAFPCLALARACAERQDASCAVMNGANEAAVALFLAGKITFTGIFDVCERAVDELGRAACDSVGDALEADQAAKAFVRSSCGG